MRLRERLDEILEGLPDSWSEVRLSLTVGDPADDDRAGLVLAPLSPGRSGSTFRLTLTPAGLQGSSTEAARRVLDRLEQEGIDTRLTLLGTDAVELGSAPHRPPSAALSTSWDALVAGLPPDWSDLYLEVELGSSDELERAALLMAPANPLLWDGGRPGLRFRAARVAGYGVAPMMARRVLARLDGEEIRGTLRLLRVQSDTRHVLTQGPVWRDAGRAV